MTKYKSPRFYPFCTLFIDLPLSALCAQVNLMVTQNCKPGLNWFYVIKQLSAEPSTDLGEWERTSCQGSTFKNIMMHSFMKTLQAETQSCDAAFYDLVVSEKKAAYESSLANLKLYVVLWPKEIGCIVKTKLKARMEAGRCGSCIDWMKILQGNIHLLRQGRRGGCLSLQGQDTKHLTLTQKQQAEQTKRAQLNSLTIKFSPTAFP